jgi:hypothetical protein
MIWSMWRVPAAALIVTVTVPVAGCGGPANTPPVGTAATSAVPTASDKPSSTNRGANTAPSRPLSGARPVE